MSKLTFLGRAGTRIALLALTLTAAACDPMGLASLFDRAPTGNSVLTLLDTDGRELSIGDAVHGSLSSADILSVDGSHLEAWALDADAGETFSIDLISEDFDSYLYVVGPGFAEALRDDDGGGACHARLDFTVLETGRFHVVASTMSAQTGTYQLRVSEEPRERAAMSCGGIDGTRLSALPTNGRELDLDVPSHGQLRGNEPSIENGRPVQAWTLRGRAGETLVVSLVADAFDPYLYAFGPGMAEVRTDDDGGSGLNSQLTLTFSTDGTFVIGAAALSEGAVGPYTVSVAEPLDLASLATEGRQVQRSIDQYGVLSATDPVIDGRPLQAWAFEARAGQSVIVDLISEDFDSYLQIVGPGMSAPLSNDDGGGDLHSRLSVTFPQNGTYRIVAGSLGEDQGSYTLRIR